MAALKAIDQDGEISALLAKVATGLIDQDDLSTMVQWMRHWLQLKALLECGRLTFKELKILLLGMEGPKDDLPEDDGEESQDEPDKEPTTNKRKGHGKISAKKYTGCRKVEVKPADLMAGDECPQCVGPRKGRLHHHKPSRPQVRLRLSGSAPITGTLYQGTPLCCSKCSATYQPDWSEDARGETYDASAKATVTLMRHWYGFPSYRLEKLQREWCIPLPDSTQSDLIKDCLSAVEPVYHQIYRHAANADQFIIDDTTARIQSIISDRKKHPEQARYAAHITGIIARTRQRDIIIYRVGTLHAGENLEDLLAHRAGDLPPPLQMSDALAANTDHPYQTRVAYCLNHARGHFDDVAENFPVACRKVLDLIAKVYHHEGRVKRLQMDDCRRLAYHRRHSKPLMKKLFRYLKSLRSSGRVEASSGLGKAVAYVLKRRVELTRFLHIPGAPLDSNDIERALKSAVLIRKNSLFYRNEVSAYGAGILMTMAATCVSCGIDPMRYFTTLIASREQVQTHPAGWLPWEDWGEDARPTV